MPDEPYTFEIDLPGVTLSNYDNHIVRKLSAMKDQFDDSQAFEQMLEQEDRVLYEVFELRRPEVAGELLHGLSVVHPGKVGDEYFMTKGHFHTVLETAELYLCLRGEGFMMMETPEGDWSAEPLKPNTALYVPPRWAHRSINTSSKEDLVMFFAYPGNAGHDYGSIEKQGFRKLVVERNSTPLIVDNPRWLSPESR